MNTTYAVEPTETNAEEQEAWDEFCEWWEEWGDTI